MNDFRLVTKVYPTYSVVYRANEFISKHRSNSGKMSYLLNENRFTGIVQSKKSVKRLKNCINWLVIQAVQKRILDRISGKHVYFRINFITLTLPAGIQMHTDNLIKSDLLNQFLTEMRQKAGLKNYIWKAEPQLNGNIHFHLTTDTFIHWKYIREVWNRILDKSGYIELYRNNQKRFHENGFKIRTDLLNIWPLCSQFVAYKSGIECNWSNPNTIDVHAVKNIKNLSAYISKYMCKADLNKRFIKGRVWSCNEKLSKCNSLNFELSGTKFGIDFNSFLNDKEFYTTEYCNIFKYSAKDLVYNSSGMVKKEIWYFINYLRNVQGYIWDDVEKCVKFKF